MKEVLHKNFHTLRQVPTGKPGRKQMFILDTWKPKQNVWIIGCQVGLLCFRSDNMELYLAVSRNNKLTPEKYFVGLKQDYLFYAQRDVYTFSTAPGDLTQETFLPAGYGFFVKKGEPIYIKVGVLNLTSTDMAYDAFCNIYYTLTDEE